MTTERTNQVSVKTKLLQDAQILLWAVLALVLVLLAILELATAGNTDGLQVKETINASSSLISVTDKNYLCAVDGILYNPTDDKITVEKLTVTVVDDKNTHVVEFEGFSVLPRTSHELATTWTDRKGYDTVKEIRATVDGEDRILVNADAKTPVSGGLIFYAVLLAVVAFLLVRASKIRYYLWQEERMSA
jgi:hypothetical protein